MFKSWHQHKEVVFKSAAIVVVLIYKMSLYIFMQIIIALACLSGIYMHFPSCVDENTESNRDPEAS